MREILFRGKPVESEEWLMGSYIWGTRPGIRHYIQEEDGYMSPDITEVNPDTVSEFTGLRDRFGHKIFEGDIVRFKDHGDAFIVTLDQFAWELLSPIYPYYRHRLELEDDQRLEIIGNLFDNPELLDEKE